MALGERQRGLFQSLGAEIIGGRIDEVARECDARGDALKARRIDAFGCAEPRRLGRRLLIAGEPIGRE